MSIESPAKKDQSAFKIIDGKIAMSLAKAKAKAKHQPDPLKHQADAKKSKKLAEAKQANIQAMDLLLQSFPAAFDLHNRKPLKTGIKDELATWAADNSISKKALSGALRYYTSGNSYLHATVNNNQRINLQGTEVEEVSAEQKQYAQMLLNKRNSNTNNA
ncbi:ProP expression regulator [Piscirickettsia salmonis]|uniref:ProQ/FINO family protein n=1 Tax=Piscirickettsia salmonis TaxID=1238 RepID=UPI0012B921A2|nr:ProQ/FinO family protein [Piscirickettsia salmonis]QGP48764.1 ProP expression regulator [Piscirickettsia salmonis]QGP52790.1 ProP expression regulator [Piscirickettsia salmonis]QGP57653.1 ProP expression regulator [Piscirickettsia salmonis]